MKQESKKITAKESKAKLSYLGWADPKSPVYQVNSLVSGFLIQPARKISSQNKSKG